MNHQIATGIIRPGFTLPGALRDQDGRVLVGAGVTLTVGLLRTLGRRLIVGVYGADDWPAEFRQVPPSAGRHKAQPPTAKRASAPRVIDVRLRASAKPGAETPRAAPPQNPPGDGRARQPPRPAGAEGGETLAAAPSRPNAEATTEIQAQALRLGMRVSEDLCDEQGVLLLSSGSRITRRFLELLRQRGIRKVRSGPQAPRETPSTARRPRKPALAAHSERGAPVREMKAPQRTTAGAGPRLALSDLRAEVERGVQRHISASTDLRDLFATLRTDGASAAQAARGVVGDFSASLALDADLLPTIITMQRSQNDYLFGHSLNVALLSLAIGGRLGLPRGELFDLGVSALMQDVGMLSMPDSIRFAPRVLTPEERKVIEVHPLFTLDQLESMDNLPAAAAQVGYQAHERLDGCGYPRGLRGREVHAHARIVAVADVFCAMIHARPHRPALPKHEATRAILMQASQGKLDRDVCRALLDTCSAFPVGCVVTLDNGVRGEVIRANPGQHTRPVIVELDSEGKASDRVLDLSTHPDVHIVSVSS